MNVPQIITAAIAVLATVIAFVSLYRTGRVQRQQLHLQAKQEELIDLQLESLRKQATQPVPTPQEKADIRVDLELFGQDYKFIITNWGRVPARDVTFDLDVEPDKETPLVQGDYDEKIPIAELAPGARCPLWAAITFDTGTTFPAKWSWRNPDGSEETRSSLLAI
jgi:type II secretory pathway pseudopilin PulG